MSSKPAILPPFRAEQVGSLLRPASLLAAHEQRKREQISAVELKKHEDDAIRDVVARQESTGLLSITDGEFRREWWHLDFLRCLDGVTLRDGSAGGFVGAETQPPIATVTGRVRCRGPIMTEDFRFLRAVTRRTAKLTIPSPSMLHLRGGRNAISREVYPDLGEFWSDVANAYAQAITYIADAGCTYLQLDDVAFAYLADEKFRDGCRRNGDDPEALPQRYVDTLNAVLRSRPAGMVVALHTCHGNFRSAWATKGGYEPVAEVLFNSNIDAFFMEFDSSRSGSFEPLRFLPRDKKVVLGLITTKVGQIESEQELMRRIDAAARIVPLENLCLSPQCGFASHESGNKLSHEDQWRKLELVVNVARKVWGSQA